MSIADVLDLTVSEALAVFPRRPRSLPAPGAPRRSGARLSAPGPTGAHALRRRGAAPQARRASGGNAVRSASAQAAAAQRGKDGASARGSLFLFDEPTTGLHFDDVAKLLRAFRRLIDAGHSLLVIEHNLDVVRAADWIIDLGPGGRRGRRARSSAPARRPRSHALPASHTGRALIGRHSVPMRLCATAGSRPYAKTRQRRRAQHRRPSRFAAPASTISRTSTWISGVNKFTVITGVSGSGKSTLAFDILFAEGQRRYLESLKPTRGSSCSPRRAPTSTPFSASRPRWRSSSAPAAADTRARWRR